MPSRNVAKPDIPESFYHIYARGASKQQIFLEPADYRYFIGLFARYLSLEPSSSPIGVPYPHYREEIKLLAFCLMPNHFHLLVFQQDRAAMSKFMRSVMTSYGRYFNLKYQRSGSLYESTYKASLVSQDAYLLHISRYIHLNPRYWRQYKYSSLHYYTGAEAPEWLQPEQIRTLFSGTNDYTTFLSDYEDKKNTLALIKHDLADR